MTIFDDIRKDRDFCGKLPGFAACDCEEDGCFHDQVNAAQVRRVARLDRLERAILDHADWLMHEIKVCKAAGDAIGVRAYGRTLAAFRAACGEGEL